MRYIARKELGRRARLAVGLSVLLCSGTMVVHALLGSSANAASSGPPGGETIYQYGP